MPPKKTGKDAKKLKQTTLFDGPMSPSKSPPKAKKSPQSSSARGRRPVPSRSQRDNTPSNSSSSDIGDIHFAPVEKNADEHDSNDDEVVPSPFKSTGKRRRIVRLASDSESEQSIVFISPKTKTKAVREDSEEADEPVTRKKRRLRRQTSDETKASESDEDMERLASEVDEESILDSRLRKRDKRSDFQKNLDKLKRRKLKMKDEEEDEEAEEEQEEEEIIKPFRGSKPSSERIGESDDEEIDSGNSSDFIVEDDNVVDLPPQFSMETHQDLSHQFKKIFQFFVHVAVHPPDKRANFMQRQLESEEYFSVPLQVTRRKISGLMDSMVSSSVWKPEFKRSLEKYPDFTLTALDFAVPSCDACNLGGRLSKFVAHLTGSEYDKCGFQPLSTEDSDEEEREENDQKEFHLGRFCARRTRAYHQFSHWEYTLFQAFCTEIDELRNSSSSKGFHKVAFYRGLKPPQDLEDADGLCDWLDERKIIEMEWEKLKTMMESARHLDIRGKGDDDD